MCCSLHFSLYILCCFGTLPLLVLEWNGGPLYLAIFLLWVPFLHYIHCHNFFSWKLFLPFCCCWYGQQQWHWHCHHLCRAILATSLMGETSYVVYILAYFPHKGTLNKLGIWHICSIWRANLLLTYIYGSSSKLKLHFVVLYWYLQYCWIFMYTKVVVEWDKHVHISVLGICQWYVIYVYQCFWPQCW